MQFLWIISAERRLQKAITWYGDLFKVLKNISYNPLVSNFLFPFSQCLAAPMSPVSYNAEY